MTLPLDAAARPVLCLRPRQAFRLFAGALLLLWTAASGYYIVFHDAVLATLLGRQAEIQYAYEDRIAELREALEQAGARTLRDGEAGKDMLRDLAQRSLQLEARADRLDALIGTTGHAAELRLHAAPDADRRADSGSAEIASRVAALEARQHAVVGAVRMRTERANGKIQAVLAELGLAPAADPVAMGGPFVPVVEGSQLQDENLALLKDALARRRGLEAVAARLPLRQPIEGQLDVTSVFGVRRDPFYGRLALHTGIDLRRDFGSQVRAVAAGTVTVAGSESGYGTLVEIDHGNGYATRYAHLSVISVKVGDRLTAGAGVGQVGTTGRSTGPHLHYEVRIAGEPVDPARYLKLAAAIAE